MAEAWRPDGSGLAVAVTVQPRARRAGVGGMAPGPRLRIAVTEAPEDGRATRAACAALAAALGVPASSVVLRVGAASRRKVLHVAGDAPALAASLEALQRGEAT